MNTLKIYDNFYRIPRASARELSDGGGPLGFDITKAIEIDYIINKFKCDAIIETGCNMGDTTEYFTKQYPDLKIITCDTIQKYTSFVQYRLLNQKNITVINAPSTNVIELYKDTFKKPFYYLDAHWYENWPLIDEINSISSGLVCIDDFDIGHPRFSYDEYNGIKCDCRILINSQKNITVYFVNNPEHEHSLPCLQINRRSGRCYFQVGLDNNHFENSDFFIKKKL